MSSYASEFDLYRFGIPKSALVGKPVEDIRAALDAASEVADMHMRARYNLPLLRWGDDLRRLVCMIAAHDLLVVQGQNPQIGADMALENRAKQAMATLKDVSNQIAHLNVTPTMDQAPGFDQPFVITGAMRGF